jgi:hypothetical protein
MRVLEDHELKDVAGGSMRGEVAVGLSVGMSPALAGAGFGFVLGSGIPLVGNLAGAGAGLVIGYAAGLTFLMTA